MSGSVLRLEHVCRLRSFVMVENEALVFGSSLDKKMKSMNEGKKEGGKCWTQ